MATRRMEKLVYKLHGKELNLNDEVWDEDNKLYFSVNEKWALSSVSLHPERFFWKQEDALRKRLQRWKRKNKGKKLDVKYDTDFFDAIEQME